MGTLLYVLIPLLVVLAIVLYVYRPGAKKRYDQDAAIPFADESNPAGKQSATDSTDAK